MEQILHKRTKIVATVGPASRDPAVLRSLFLCGANVLRLNFSHGAPEEHAAVIRSARQISRELGIHTAVLQDLPTGARPQGRQTLPARLHVRSSPTQESSTLIHRPAIN